MKKNAGISIASIMIATFVLTGCSTLEPTRTGFLDDYSLLDAKPKKGIYYDIKASGRNYSKIMIEPVVIYLSEDAKGAGVDKAELKELANYFYIELVSALKNDYQLVEKPGRGVAKLRVAVTDVMPNIPALNIQFATKLSKAGAGGAGMETELVDSVSNERLLAVVTRQKAPFKRLGDYGRGFEKWGNTQLNFENWSKKIKEKVDEINQ